MLILGHSGFTLLATHPFRRQIEKRWLIFGAIGPDLLDKPLFFIAKHLVDSTSLSMITGTRTFGHSSFLFIPVIALAAWTGRLSAVSFALGWILHLLIDICGDSYEFFDKSPTVKALLYPVLAPFFHINSPTVGLVQHIGGRLGSAYVLYGEVLGGLILLGYGIESWWISRKSKLGH